MSDFACRFAVASMCRGQVQKNFDDLTRRVIGADDTWDMSTTMNPAASSSTCQTTTEIARILRRAMGNPDELVVEMQYADSQGRITQRTISPIRFVGSDRVLALCLCREEPRQFYLNRCSAVRLLRAEDVLMPIAMG